MFVEVNYDVYYDVGLLAQDHGRGGGRGRNLEGEQGRRRSVAPSGRIIYHNMI